MKRKTIAILCGSALLVSLIAVANYFFPLKYLLSSERIGTYEISVMRESRQSREARVILESNGIEIQFPLPNGAVPFENTAYPARDNVKQYLIPVESFQPYLHELLPLHGFEAEQMGAWVSICSKEIPMQIGMSSAMFTGGFMRIEVSQVP
jgi:hypothetical protein